VEIPRKHAVVNLRDLARWPLLLATGVLLTGGVVLATQEGISPETRVALTVLGSVCLGAWIALLASSGHDGKDPD
jgi:hypothetical protein